MSANARRGPYPPEYRREGHNQNESAGRELLRESVTLTSQEDIDSLMRMAEKKNAIPQLIELPRHIYIPQGVPSLDFRKACFIAPSVGGTPTLLFSWKCPPGTVAIFTHYALYCDAQDATKVEFLPTVDGNRIFPYHGDPSNNFKMNLGLAPDLSNISLIQANLILQPGQSLSWSILNTDSVEVAMGVRMVGYTDNKNPINVGSFGS